MREVSLADDVYQQVELLARAWGVPMDGVIRRLLDDFRAPADSETGQVPQATQIAVHAVYAGVRTNGLYDRATQALKITTGPLAGRVFSKPSGAAVALVAHLRPDVNANRNGWSFWIVSGTGKRLQSERNARPASAD